MARKPLSPILTSAMSGNSSGLASYLKIGSDVEVSDRDGRTPLMHAVISRSLDCVLRLIAAGADVNRKDKRGWTALHFAAQDNAASIVNELVKVRAEADAPDEHGNTPLFRAVFSYRGTEEAITSLLAAGANPDKLNLYGVSPRSLAETIASYDTRKFFA
jgi:ankyrin repeat protein